MTITNKCCNQFGERDEIQAIIDKLRADVAERDERIAELESRPSLERFEMLVGIMYSEAMNSTDTEDCEIATRTLELINNFRERDDVEVSDEKL